MLGNWENLIENLDIDDKECLKDVKELEIFGSKERKALFTLHK